MRILVLSFVMLFSAMMPFTAQAFIPRGMLILHKTAENSGNGIYQIEQEVQFPTAQDHFVLKETWIVENESAMRLLVTGTKEYKDSIRMNFLYVGGQRLQVVDGKKVSSKLSDDFIEKYFHFRSSEIFANNLVTMKIAPRSLMERKPLEALKNFEYRPEGFLRLARVGGVINYAFGTPSPVDSTDTPPGLWIEQDQFVIRKIRFPSQVEVTADKHSQYAHGLVFPRKRTVLWDNNSVQIQALSVVSKPKNPSLFSSVNLEPTKLEALDGLPSRALIEDFYKRFR